MIHPDGYFTYLPLFDITHIIFISLIHGHPLYILYTHDHQLQNNNRCAHSLQVQLGMATIMYYVHTIKKKKKLGTLN